MKRILGASAVTLTLASPALAYPAAGDAAHGTCQRTYTIAMVKRALIRNYWGARSPTYLDARRLRRYARCLRRPEGLPVVGRIWHQERAANALRRAEAAQFTGYVVSGTVSTFGPPLEGAGQTADGGSDARPCIALLDTSTLGRMFRVTIDGHTADLLHCDSGPYAGDRSIDVTGSGDYALGLDPSSFPTDSWGIARMLR